MPDIRIALDQYYSRYKWNRESAEYVERHGIDLSNVNARGGLIAVLPCTFDGRGHFVLDGDRSQPAAIVEALGVDADTVVDLVAWPVERPDLFATAGGFDALGIDQVSNPASYAFGTALSVHRTPLNWLKARCRGCVVLHHEHVVCWLGQALGPLLAEDLEHARQLYGMLHRPFDRRRLLVPQSEQGKAA